MTNVGCRYKICCQKLISSFRAKTLLSGEQCPSTATRTPEPAARLSRALARARLAVGLAHPNVHAHAPERPFEDYTESPDSQTLPDSFLASRG
ncbi:hypothetical protein CRG98_003623 [Punica granatum]|uniref:Uncharacterized protein n=1 Tax=Punica granatum TaxID=22663 RepID=A0A2I0L5I7_PUNGR|nr:hypothetical protein CRG98_003623 [Punica granatum]